ncbi:conserved domain protein [Bacteroides fluxus YIT 12057]|uniref:Conserved domain protein n=1 Tax=Bacteroides fluxus YIT 12057 TaxID=763034 RepID=F3PU47_9BACE|nr:conserved domain protein [Bacteroides fluxus YIT 12057]
MISCLCHQMWAGSLFFCLASLTICLLPSICNFPGQLFQVKTSVLLYFVEQDGFPEHKK